MRPKLTITYLSTLVFLGLIVGLVYVINTILCSYTDSTCQLDRNKLIILPYACGTLITCLLGILPFRFIKEKSRRRTAYRVAHIVGITVSGIIWSIFQILNTPDEINSFPLVVIFAFGMSVVYLNFGRIIETTMAAVVFITMVAFPYYFLDIAFQIDEAATFSILIIISLLLIFISAIGTSKAQKAKHLNEQLKKLVYKHQINMINVRKYTLEETMPTGQGEACVISFDIIGSSKIQHLKAKDFFRNVFRRCNQIMAEGYDEKELKANAYRIKEMGDGFICSVGYPFLSTNNSPAIGALQIAQKFTEVLAEEVDKLDYPEPIHCGIGIAADTITGFYPEFGAKEYDLFGRAIVLATRYEAMRKTLLQNQPATSIIIIQERVYLSLDSQSRAEFSVFHLSEHGVVIRDDPAATKLYYKLILDSTSKVSKNLTSEIPTVSKKQPTKLVS